MIAMIFLAVFLGVGGIMGTASDFEQSELNEFIDAGAVEVTGTVTDILADSQTFVEYYVKEEDMYYTTSLSVVNSEYPQKASVSVYYDPKNPSNCRIPDISVDAFEMIAGIFSASGVILAVVFTIISIPLLIVGIILVRRPKAQITN